MEDKPTFKDIIRQKQNRLEEKINVDAGLLSKLEEYEIISRIQRTDIEVHAFLFIIFYIFFLRLNACETQPTLQL